jgi:hypothetical protein
MKWVLFVCLWSVVVAGGLPTRLQAELDGRFGAWHSQLFGVVSSLLEFFCGLGLVRFVILMSGVGRLAGGKGVVLGIVGFYLLLEGIVRLAVTTRLTEGALPSLPVVLAVRAFKGISRTV